MGIGLWEILLLMGVALVVIGPEKFPDFAKIVLRTFRDLRGYVDDVKNEVTKELRPVEKEVRNLSRYDPETYLDAMSRATATPASPVKSAIPEEPVKAGADTIEAPSELTEPPADNPPAPEKADDPFNRTKPGDYDD